MGYKQIILSFTLLFSFSTIANGVFPIPLKKQIKEANAIVDGVFQSSSEVVLGGEKYNQASFKLIKSHGLDTGTLQKNYLFKVHYKNSANNQENYVDFKTNERVVLFLEEDNSGNYFLKNNGISKYTFIKRGRRDFLISAVFPYHPVIGQFNYETLNEKLKALKKNGHFTYHVDGDKKFIKFKKSRSFSNSPSRSISSISKKRERKPSSFVNGNQINVAWLMVIFAVLAAFSRFVFIREE